MYFHHPANLSITPSNIIKTQGNQLNIKNEFLINIEYANGRSNRVSCIRDQAAS